MIVSTQKYEIGDAILFDLNPDYGRLISERIMEHTPSLFTYFPEDE